MNKNIKYIIIVCMLAICAFTVKKYVTSKKAPESNSYNELSTILINVLDRELFEDAHIPGSINIPFEDFDSQAFTDKEKTYIFYCSNTLCTASHDAAKQLGKKGFKNVHVYEGGMAEWYQHNQEDPCKYPLNGSAQEAYLRVTFPLKKSLSEKKYQKISTHDLQQMLKAANIIIV